MSTRAELVFDGHAILGEGPVWDPRDSILYWVDIDGCVVHRLKSDGAHDETNVGQKVGAVAPRAAGGLLLAVKQGFAFMDTWGSPLRVVATLETDKPANRMNDGKVDSCGRFWAGTMSPERGDGTLYRLDPDGSVHTMIPGVTISNGIGWSPDDATMYYIDTPTRRVDAFTYDRESGAIRDRRTIIHVAKEHGHPDGMAVDDAGCLWVAHWNGHAVRRYTPEGKIDVTIELPAARVTSCTFAGSRRSELYITTASVGLSAEERAQQPHAGGLFVATPGVQGLPGFAFG